MPELAEVALFARDLNKAASGKVVRRVSFHNTEDWGLTIIPAAQRKLLRNLQGKTISFQSHGKALHTYIDSVPVPTIEFRLAMTGQFHSTQKKAFKRHYFLGIHFDDSSIFFADPRRFGRVVPPTNSSLALGGYSKAMGFWKARKIMVPDGYNKGPKITWLLKHGEQTGIGNYMANEALGALNLSPFTPCSSLREATEILRACQKISKQSFQKSGNSFATGFFLIDGSEGSYSKFCKFYLNKEVPKYMFRGRPLYTYFDPP